MLSSVISLGKYSKSLSLILPILLSHWWRSAYTLFFEFWRRLRDYISFHLYVYYLRYAWLISSCLFIFVIFFSINHLRIIRVSRISFIYCFFVNYLSVPYFLVTLLRNGQVDTFGHTLSFGCHAADNYEVWSIR